MKALKVLGVLFICLGCMAAFVGVAAAVLPVIQNDQLQLVLSSFAMPAANPVVNAMNAAMTYALRNCYGVMLAGAGGAIVGALLLLSASKGETAAKQTAYAGTRQPPVQRSAARPAQNEAVPAWRASKAEAAAARNPFAARMASDMMSYRASRTASSPAYQAEPSAPTFAPAVQRQPETPPAPASAAFAPSPYARPEPSPVERPSPYAKPAPVPAEQLSPYARPEPILAEPPAAEMSAPEPPAPPQTAAPAPAKAAEPLAQPYAPLFAERELPAEAPTGPPTSAAPEPPASPRYASPAPASARKSEPAAPAPPTAEPPKRTLPAGWASPAQAGWLTPKKKPAPDLTAPVPPLPVKTEKAQSAPPKVRIKSTMGKHHK